MAMSNMNCSLRFNSSAHNGALSEDERLAMDELPEDSCPTTIQKCHLARKFSR
jgi:hypothetical protein